MHRRLNKIKIEGWHQPDGAGYGWAPCRDARAEVFFIFDRDGTKLSREFKTRREAESYVKEHAKCTA